MENTDYTPYFKGFELREKPKPEFILMTTGVNHKLFGYRTILLNIRFI
jgi:hypothetical protein